MTDKIAVIFSNNLRKLCATKNSISEVCADLKINRQQFNKYLNGVNVPGKSTISKISVYFEISSSDLFSVQAENIDKNIYDTIVNTLSRGRAEILSDGFYFVYYSLVVDPKYFVRSLVVIKNSGNTTLFTRVNHAREYRNQKFSISNRHLGIVQSIDNVLHFIARNESAPNEISLAKFEPLFPGGNDFFVGLSMLRVPVGSFGTIAIRTALVTAPDQSLRSAVSQCGIFPYEGSGLNDHIRQAIQAAPQGNYPGLDMFNVHRDLRF